MTRPHFVVFGSILDAKAELCILEASFQHQQRHLDNPWAGERPPVSCMGRPSSISKTGGRFLTQPWALLQLCSLLQLVFTFQRIGKPRTRSLPEVWGRDSRHKRASLPQHAEITPQVHQTQVKVFLQSAFIQLLPQPGGHILVKQYYNVKPAKNPFLSSSRVIPVPSCECWR